MGLDGKYSIGYAVEGYWRCFSLKVHRKGLKFDDYLKSKENSTNCLIWGILMSNPLQ